MAVEKDALLGEDPSQQRHAGGQLVDDENIGFELSQLIGEECDGEDEMYLSQCRKQDMKAV